MNECDCSEEYGPCEEHALVLAQREGASTRTADELLLVFVDDATDLGVQLSPWGERVYDDAHMATSCGNGWLDASGVDEHLRDELISLADQCESDLATMDQPAFTFWDDGYRIVRIIDGPLVDEESGR